MTTLNPKTGILAGGLAVIALIAGAGWYHSAHNQPGTASTAFYNPSANNGAVNPAPATDANYNSSVNPNQTGYPNAQSSNGYAQPGYNSSAAGYNSSTGYNTDSNGTNGYASNGQQGVYNATSAGYNPGIDNNGYTTSDGTYVERNRYGYSTSPYVSGRYIRSIRRPVRVYYPPASRTTVTREAVYENDRPYDTHYVERTSVYERRHRRSGKKSIAIVAGSAAGGAAIGALAGGGKGAALGALAGGGAGFIYDRLTHNR